MAMRKGLPAKLAATDADDTRYGLAGLIVANADGTPRGGVLSPVGTNIVTATATMNVSVARFQGAAVRDGGVVLLANDGPTNVLLDAAPAANSRIDVIYAKQNDASSTVSVPDANNTPVLGFSKGTAGAVPVKPSIPVGALELATVTIPSTATATNSAGVVITQTAQFTATAGAAVPFRSRSEMDAVTTLAVGQLASEPVAGLCRWSGSRWSRVNSGWNLIRPAALTGATVADDGTIVFSSVNAVIFDGVFSSVFDSYVVEIDITGASAITNLFAQFRAAGATNGTNTYYAQVLFGQQSTVTAVAQNTQSSWTLTATQGIYHATRLEVRRPADAAVRTFGIVDSASVDVTSSAVMGSNRSTLWHGTPAAYDGLRIAAAGAITISGVIRVYGLYNG